MSGRTLNSAILLLIVGNAFAIGSDVIVKLVSTDVPIFQFVFMRSLCSVILLVPFWQQMDRETPLSGLKIHAFRAHVSLTGVVCLVFALGNLPLATVTALFYTSPLMVVLIAILLFGERLNWRSVLAVISGALGIIVILRPVEVDWAAFSALGVAACLAIMRVIVRKLPKHQTTIHALMLNYLLVLPASLLMALIEAAPVDWSLLISAMGSSLFILGYNMTVLLAYRNAHASHVTSAEYTGLIWSVLIGWVWFGEAPSLWFLAGATMIITPLILLLLKPRRSQ
ncbi:MAG: DMT family transporter [Halomonas sp.]|nr:DMT family transporter [Halomonas sp.]